MQLRRVKPSSVARALSLPGSISPRCQRCARRARGGLEGALGIRCRAPRSGHCLTPARGPKAGRLQGPWRQKTARLRLEDCGYPDPLRRVEAGAGKRQLTGKPKKMVLPDRIELSTSPLPMECSTTELRQHAPDHGNRPKGPFKAGRSLPQGARLRKRGTPLWDAKNRQIGAEPRAFAAICRYWR
jgi:hypothetical protein